MAGKSKVEVIVRGVMIDAGALLVCINRARGHQFLPGGHIEFREPAADALIREMKEETGRCVQVGQPLGVCEAAFTQDEDDGQHVHHELNILFEMHPADADGAAAWRSLASREDGIAFDWLPLRTLRDDQAGATLLPAGINAILVEWLDGKGAGCLWRTLWR